MSVNSGIVPGASGRAQETRRISNAAMNTNGSDVMTSAPSWKESWICVGNSAMSSSGHLPKGTMRITTVMPTIHMVAPHDFL